LIREKQKVSRDNFNKIKCEEQKKYLEICELAWNEYLKIKEPQLQKYKINTTPMCIQYKLAQNNLLRKFKEDTAPFRAEYVKNVKTALKKYEAVSDKALKIMRYNLENFEVLKDG